MRRKFHTLFLVESLWWSVNALAVPKPHVITFGKWAQGKWYVGSEGKSVDLKVRALYVDNRLKEYTTGSPHEVNDRLFVVRRMFRLNDALPSETIAVDVVNDAEDDEEGGE